MHSLRYPPFSKKLPVLDFIVHVFPAQTRVTVLPKPSIKYFVFCQIGFGLIEPPVVNPRRQLFVSVDSDIPSGDHIDSFPWADDSLGWKVFKI